MAFLAAPLTLPLIGTTTVGATLGTAFSALSMIGDFMSAKNTAKAQAQQGAYENKVAQQNAIQAEAESQRAAIERRREGALAESSLVAMAAAGGGGTSDPTVAKLREDIMTQSEKNFQAELYSGKSRGDAYRQQGAMAAYQGQLDAKATKSAATSALIGGTVGLMAKYGGGGPPKTGASTGMAYSYVPGGGGVYKTPGSASFNSSTINWYK